jgi:hypothetical protein
MVLTLAVGLLLVVSPDAPADTFPAGPPRPKLFASVYGVHPFKTLPDVSSVSTQTRTEGVHSAAQAGQIVGTSEGVLFTLDENGKEQAML